MISFRDYLGLSNSCLYESMPSSVERADLDFKISVALAVFMCAPAPTRTTCKQYADAAKGDVNFRYFI